HAARAQGARRTSSSPRHPTFRAVRRANGARPVVCPKRASCGEVTLHRPTDDYHGRGRAPAGNDAPAMKRLLRRVVAKPRRFEVIEGVGPCLACPGLKDPVSNGDRKAERCCPRSSCGARASSPKDGDGSLDLRCTTRFATCRRLEAPDRTL